MNQDKVQQIQDEEYDFPYHHIPHYKQVFSQCFNWSWGINYVATIEFLRDKLKQETFESLVDVGCGDGRLVKELRQDFPSKRVEGIDYSEKAITLARLMDSQGKYHCVDILQKNFNQTYNIALLIEVFEHIPPDKGNAFLEAVTHLLNPGGILWLTVPHSNVPVEAKHYRHFSVKTISSCLSPYFDILEIIPFERKGKRKQLLDLLLANKLFILNSGRLKNIIYDYYKKNLFFVEKEEVCQRLYIKAKLKH